MSKISNRNLRLISYIQIADLCFAHNTCKTCIMRGDDGCLLDNMCNKTLLKVYSLKKAYEHCEKYNCSTCPYILDKFDPTIECDFINFLKKMGVTYKW